MAAATTPFARVFEYGGAEGKFNYFIDGSYDHNELGIENPTSMSTAIHDETEQFKTFMYGSYVIDASSRLTMMASASYTDFQVPNTPGVAQEPRLQPIRHMAPR